MRRQRRRRPGGQCPTPLFLLLSLLSLSHGAAAAAGFIIPATGRPASSTRLHSVNIPSSSAPDPASAPGGVRPTIAAAAAAAAAPAIPAPVARRVGGGSRTASGAAAAAPAPPLRPAVPPPPPPLPLVVEPPLVWGPAPVAWGVPEPAAAAAAAAAGAPAPAASLPEEGGWRVAEKRLRALVMDRGGAAAGAAAVVVKACKGLLEACFDVAEEEENEREEAAVAVAWVVEEVLQQQQQQQEHEEGEGGALRLLALRACAATGAAEAAAALFLQLSASYRQQQQQPEALELALEACSRASPSSSPSDARAAALSVVRAAVGLHLSPRALALAAAAIDNAGAGGAAGALRLLIGDARRAGAALPAWLYTRAMRAALAEEEGDGGLSSAAAVVALLYEEALGSSVVAEEREEEEEENDEEEMMALHEAALAAHAAQGQWSPALAVLERLRTSGRAPSPACFNHAVQACCLAGEWERGAGLLRRMEAAGLDAGEETYLGVLQALGKAGQWQGALKLLEHVTATQQRRQQQQQGPEKGAAGVGVTPAMAKAAAAICVRAGKFAEARALVDRAMAAAAAVAGGESPELLELGLWALVMAPSPALGDGGSTAEQAARLIQRLMTLTEKEDEAGKERPISLDAYEHACQALAQSPAREHHEALLRAVHAHAVAHQAIPALYPEKSGSGGPLDLRGLRPALARVALAEALARLPAVEDGGEGEDKRPPLVLITGTGAIKAHVRRFLQSKACFVGRPFNPLPMPYNHGRLLLPWGQIRQWQAAGARVCLSSSPASTDEGESRRRQRRLWKGIVDG